MTIEKYSQEYESQVIDLWNRTLFFDPITVKKFRNQILFDENYDEDLCMVAIEDSNIVGFILGTKRKFPYMERGLEPEKAWINIIIVDKEYRNKGIGQSLYNNIEEKFIKLNAKTIILGAYSPNYFFWGLDEDNYPESVDFFERNGYKALDKHYSMYKDLHGFVIPKDTIEKITNAENLGYSFINFEYKYSLEVIEFLRKEFGGGWKRNALILMKSGIAEDTIILALNKERKICGICMREIDGNPMRFGPIGIKKEIRNLGLGTILLDLQCYEMAKKGIYHMFFITTDENGKRYYERNNLKVFRSFIEYRKEL